MSRRLCANKRGISPVVATVILVAVTIVVAVAVAYWMGGIAGLYTRYEKIEYVGAYAESTDTYKWTITITVKNTGSADATIDNVLLNGKPYNSITDADVTAEDKDGNDIYTDHLPLKVGAEAEITIIIDTSANPDASSFKSGVSVEVKLHSAGGQEYPKTVTLP